MIFSIIVGLIFCLYIVGLIIEAKNAPTIEDDRNCVKKMLEHRD